MPRKTKTAANTGKSALPQLSKQMLEELIPGPVTKEQFADIFEVVSSSKCNRVNDLTPVIRRAKCPLW